MNGEKYTTKDYTKTFSEAGQKDCQTKIDSGRRVRCEQETTGSLKNTGKRPLGIPKLRRIKKMTEAGGCAKFVFGATRSNLRKKKSILRITGVRLSRQTRGRCWIGIIPERTKKNVGAVWRRGEFQIFCRFRFPEIISYKQSVFRFRLTLHRWILVKKYN